MIWLHPLAAIALLALLGPLVVHLLAQRKAPRVPFPTLRFIQPFRLAAVRRRALDDAALLAVRAAIVGAAVGAMAGPLLVTAARKQAWDARTFRAHVVARGLTSDSDPAATFTVDRLADGVARALAWLRRQPPGRREIVLTSPFPIGALTSEDLSIVPSDVGLRFERRGQLPSTRIVSGAPALTRTDSRSPLVAIGREIELVGDRTLVRDLGPVDARPLSVEIVAPPAEQAIANTVLATALSDRIRAPLPNRAVRLVLEPSQAGAAAGGTPIGAAWMADAAARISRDLANRGWRPTPLRFGAGGDRLVVVASVHASDPATAAILGAIIESIGVPVEQPAEEIATIADDRLAAWGRAPGPAAPPRPDSIDRDDRRWLWGVVLALLAVETWMRRARRQPASMADVPHEETSRVA